MELWDVYNLDRQKTGRTMVRGDKFKTGDFHLVVHICIFNSKNQMLVQQRQPFKDGWPNMWDTTVGGSAVAGDSSQKAAERETLEEIGYEIHLDGIKPHMTINFDDGFDDIYLVYEDLDITKLKLQYEEVQQVKWATKEEIQKMIENGEFIPYYTAYIDLLFSMGKSYGSRPIRTEEG